MISILVTGAFSTGKSTLVGVLKQALEDNGHTVQTVPEVARVCPFPLNKSQGGDGTLWLLTRQVSLELEGRLSKADIMLFDRGIPDILSHYKEMVARSGPSIEVEAILPFMKIWCQHYDLVLVSCINHEIPPQTDGIRLSDPEFRRQMEELSFQTLSDLNMDFSQMPLAGEARLNYSLSKIEALLAKKKLASP